MHMRCARRACTLVHACRCGTCMHVRSPQSVSQVGDVHARVLTGVHGMSMCKPRGTWHSHAPPADGTKLLLHGDAQSRTSQPTKRVCHAAARNHFQRREGGGGDAAATGENARASAMSGEAQRRERLYDTYDPRAKCTPVAERAREPLSCYDLSLYKSSRARASQSKGESFDLYSSSFTLSHCQ